jgi:hypothetical protein
MEHGSADSHTVKVQVWSDLFNGSRNYHVPAEFSAGDLRKYLQVQMAETELRLKYNFPRHDISASVKLSAMPNLSFYLTRRKRTTSAQQALRRHALGKTKAVSGKYLHVLQESQEHQIGVFKEQSARKRKKDCEVAGNTGTAASHAARVQTLNKAMWWTPQQKEEPEGMPGRPRGPHLAHPFLVFWLPVLLPGSCLCCLIHHTALP